MGIHLSGVKAAAAQWFKDSPVEHSVLETGGLSGGFSDNLGLLHP